MRRCLSLVPVVLASFLASACGEERPPAATADGGPAIDAPTLFDSMLNDGTTSDAADSSGVEGGADSTTTLDALGDAAGDSSVPDSGISDVSVGSDGPFLADTYLDALKPEGGIPDATVITDAAVDTTPAPDASSTLVPVGKPCSVSSECDPTGASTGVCSNVAEAPDVVDPAAACMATSCEGPVGSACGAGGVGLCVGLAQCWPKCSFGSTGVATGCLGKTACNVGFWSRASGSVQGLGYCRGGCTSDADCPSPQKCQVDDGLCVASPVARAKTVGASCTGSSECPCLQATGAASGICTRFCLTGSAVAGCPTGFSCDPGLPGSDSMGVLFAGASAGLVGACSKNCASDADCVAFGGHCEANTAIGQKVCRVP